MKRISECLVCVYDEDCKKNLEKYLSENENLVRWAYIENKTINYLPPLHLYIDFGRRRFLPQTIEKVLKDYNLNHSFIDIVLYSKLDIRAIFDYAGYPALPIVSNVVV